MGGAQSIDLPGGGTEGYHVLRVSDLLTFLFNRQCFPLNPQTNLALYGTFIRKINFKIRSLFFKLISDSESAFSTT